MPRTRPVLALLLLAAVSLPAVAAYTVFLKDGSKIIAREPFTVEDTKAIIILQNGTRTSIAATEIDLERTRQANSGNLGGALVIEDGRLTELTSASEAPKRETLSDLIARREVGPGRGRSTTPETIRREAAGGEVPDAAALDFRAVPRRPFRDLEIAGEVQRFFRAQGVQQMLIYQGTQPRHMLLDLVTNSEASVFRALEVAAGCLQHIRATYPGEVAALELVFATVNREAGGQFLLDPEAAGLLTGDLIETSAFFVERVRF